MKGIRIASVVTIILCGLHTQPVEAVVLMPTWFLDPGHVSGESILRHVQEDEGFFAAIAPDGIDLEVRLGTAQAAAIVRLPPAVHSASGNIELNWFPNAEGYEIMPGYDLSPLEWVAGVLTIDFYGGVATAWQDFQGRSDWTDAGWANISEGRGDSEDDYITITYFFDDARFRPYAGSWNDSSSDSGAEPILVAYGYCVFGDWPDPSSDFTEDQAAIDDERCGVLFGRAEVLDDGYEMALHIPVAGLGPASPGEWERGDFSHVQSLRIAPAANVPAFVASFAPDNEGPLVLAAANPGYSLASNGVLSDGLYWIPRENALALDVVRNRRGCRNNTPANLFVPAHSHVPPAGTDRVALVMIHGWQSWNKLKGDTERNAAHCHPWVDTIHNIAYGEHGDWARIGEHVEMFSYRYNTNERIAMHVRGFVEALQGLLDQGYREIVIVGHSLGGVVALEARDQLNSESSGPIKGIMALGSPLRGALLHCNEVLSDGSSCIGIGDFLGRTITSTVEKIVPQGSTYDLTSYYAGTHLDSWALRNPYYSNHFVRYVSLMEPLIAIAGWSGPAPSDLRWAPTFYYLLVSSNNQRWGGNDGVVPGPSLIGSDNWLDSHQLMNPGDMHGISFVRVARDHAQIMSGCTVCADGRNWRSRNYDPYFDEVASGLLRLIGR